MVEICEKKVERAVAMECGEVRWCPLAVRMCGTSVLEFGGERILVKIGFGRSFE